MKYIVYKALCEHVKDEKKVVEYLYVLYVLLSKYGNSLFLYLEQVKVVNKELWDLLEFFKEEKFTKKDIYQLLLYAIKKTNYNIYVLRKSSSFPKIQLDWDVIEQKIEDDTGIYIKSADNKIYKRFLHDDVKKLLWI